MCVCVKCLYVRLLGQTAAPARSTTRATSAANLAWRSLREKSRSWWPRRQSARQSQNLEGLCAGNLVFVQSTRTGQPLALGISCATRTERWCKDGAKLQGSGLSVRPKSPLSPPQ